MKAKNVDSNTQFGFRLINHSSTRRFINEAYKTDLIHYLDRALTNQRKADSELEVFISKDGKNLFTKEQYRIEGDLVWKKVLKLPHSIETLYKFKNNAVKRTLMREIIDSIDTNPTEELVKTNTLNKIWHWFHAKKQLGEYLSDYSYDRPL